MARILNFTAYFPVTYRGKNADLRVKHFVYGSATATASTSFTSVERTVPGYAAYAIALSVPDNVANGEVQVDFTDSATEFRPYVEDVTATLRTSPSDAAYCRVTGYVGTDPGFKVVFRVQNQPQFVGNTLTEDRFAYTGEDGSFVVYLVQGVTYRAVCPEGGLNADVTIPASAETTLAELIA